MTTQYEVDTIIQSGLRYTEEVGQIVRSFPVRYCGLWRADEATLLSDLEAIPLRVRFGAVSIPAEGIGGVETFPQFRRQGYMRTLMSRALEGIARRVDVAFVSEGIEGVYEKFGFTNCFADAHLSIPVRNVERLASSNHPSPRRLRGFAQTDLPAMAGLYNAVHACRPWTLERQPEWNRLVLQETWRPGSEVIILEEHDRVIGYAIVEGQPFGKSGAAVVVDELAAVDGDAVRLLLAEMADRCWQKRLSEFTVHEPLDSLVGQVARELGCVYEQEFPASGGMMGAILNRSSLLQALEPELRRRLPSDDLLTAHTTAFAALCTGELIPDQPTLLRLLLGYWSSADAHMNGTLIPAHYKRLCAAWFPGGGTQLLPLPYPHKLDRY